MPTDDYLEKRRYKMSRIRSKNTKPEIIVRSLLHRLGYRFRKNVNTLPGKPDIVLRKYNTIIFVHGCFWHQHPWCKYCKIPSGNVEYWTGKLGGNVKRDKEHIESLKHLGWNVGIIWECEIKDRESLIQKLKRILSSNNN